MKTIIAVIFLVFAIVIVMSVVDQHFQIPITNSSIEATNSEDTSSIQQEEVKVVITGQVINPGTYSVIKDEYLETVIQLAGGITANADSSCFNYFYMISEDITIYIAPITNESKVSINNATISEIVTLEGVGPTLANAIISYRETYGEFLRLEDIMNVKGIGKQTFEKNKDKICL